MIESTALSYSDYSSLLVLALGSNLMYVVLRKSENRNALFFLFLKYINPPAPKETIKKIDEKIKNFKSKYVKLEFLRKLSVDAIQNTFGSKEGKQLLNTITSEDNLQEKLGRIAEKLTKVTERFSTINNLQLLALISTVYSFYVVISAPYERFFVVNFNSTLLLTNIVIIISGCLLVLLDLTLNNRFRYIPQCLFVLCLLLSTSIICGLRISWIQFDSSFVNTLLDHNYWITALVCFAGFVLYIISSIIGVFISWGFHLHISFISFFPERKLQKSVEIVKAKVTVSQLNEAIITHLNPTQLLEDIKMVDIKQENNFECKQD